MSAADLLDVIHGRQRWIQQMNLHLREADALIMPTVPIIAPQISTLEASEEAYFAANGLMLRNPSSINFLDGCAISLPCHAAANGDAPVGLSLAAVGGNDHRLLSIALAVENVLQ